jgi:hypothetical protein
MKGKTWKTVKAIHHRSKTLAQGISALLTEAH